MLCRSIAAFLWAQVGWTHHQGGPDELCHCLVSRGVPDGLVGEDCDAVTECLVVDEAHGFLVAGLAEEAFASPEHDWEDLQPQLVDEIVLNQRAQELEA